MLACITYSTLGGVTLAHPCEGESSVSVVDGRERNLTQQTGHLAAHIMMPWAPVVIRLTVAILQGGDDTLVLGSEILREQLSIDVMDGLQTRVQGQRELQELGGI